MEKNNLTDLHKLIVEWGYEKGIMTSASPMAQWEKTQEEVEELKQAILDNNKEEISDAIGDSIVTLFLQAEIQGLDIVEVLQKVYNIISKRTGKMVDGKFVKDK